MEKHIEPEPAEGGWKGLGDQELYSSIRHKQNRNLKTVEQAKERASESVITWNCDEQISCSDLILALQGTGANNALGSYVGGGGEVPPYNSYKGMCRPTGSCFWDSDLKRSIITKPFSRTGYNFSNARKLQNIAGFHVTS